MVRFALLKRALEEQKGENSRTLQSCQLAPMHWLLMAWRIGEGYCVAQLHLTLPLRLFVDSLNYYRADGVDGPPEMERS